MNAAPALDLASLRAAYAGAGLTPSALVEEIWRRVGEWDDPAIWIHRLTLEELRAHARRVEARGPADQPLYGVPFAIKDNIDLAGASTTAACPDFAYRPATSAPVVERLLEAGAIPIGKTNLDQFATGLVGMRSPYGVPRNPFDPALIPGGSSSGSAVAVAAGLVSFALGTDTAGSGRVPAGLNGIVGLKPTRGALSTRGVVPACRSLDCVSIFTLTCDDAAEVMRIAEARDEEDPYSRERTNGGAGKIGRVGVPSGPELDFGGDPQAAEVFAANVARARTLGLEVVTVDFAPFRAAARLLYEGPWLAERWEALGDFVSSHPDAVHPVTRRVLEGGAGLKATAAFAGLHRLAELRRQADAVWREIDALLVPTFPRPCTLAEVDADPFGPNAWLGTYTNFVNLLDLAAITVPAGRLPGGAPWSVTFIAPAWQEAALLDVGGHWHECIGGTLGSTPWLLPPRRSLSGAALAGNVRLVVVGAHLSGLPLNHQLTARGGRLVWSGRTASCYRLFALPDVAPPKPGLLRVNTGGAGIEVEVWELSLERFGEFVAGVPAPLGIGTVELEDGTRAMGFLCEAAATAGALDISRYGGWRAWLRTGTL